MIEQAPSAGKAIAITGTAPIVFQELLYTILHDIWGYEWATEKFVMNIIAAAVILTALIMHNRQRYKENENSKIGNANGDDKSSGVRNGSTFLGPISGAGGKSKI